MTTARENIPVSDAEWTGALLPLGLSALLLAVTSASVWTAVAVALLVVATALVAVAGVRSARHGTSARGLAAVTVVCAVLQWVRVLS